MSNHAWLDAPTGDGRWWMFDRNERFPRVRLVYVSVDDRDGETVVSVRDERGEWESATTGVQWRPLEYPDPPTVNNG